MLERHPVEANSLHLNAADNSSLCCARCTSQHFARRTINNSILPLRRSLVHCFSCKARTAAYYFPNTPASLALCANRAKAIPALDRLHFLPHLTHSSGCRAYPACSSDMKTDFSIGPFFPPQVLCSARTSTALQPPNRPASLITHGEPSR